VAPVADAALTPYSQNFEDLIATDPNALADDGWLVFGNVSDPSGTYLYGYGPQPAPNHDLAFSQIVTDQGGPEQGLQQLVVFSDYENLDHAIGNLIESNVYQEQTIGAENVGTRWVFQWNAKMGNLEGSTTAAAFIKTLDPGAGFQLTNLITEDMTAIPETWGGFSLSIDIDASLEGQILQIGFLNVATNYEGSGIFYDNVNFDLDVVGIADAGSSPNRTGMILGQNVPNPFNPRTRIDFSLDRPGMVEVSVFDVGGRRITTLHRGEMAAGEHHVVWNGRTDRGAAAAGRYFYVLETPSGRVSRSMILLK
jgi:hypothetical protein